MPPQKANIFGTLCLQMNALDPKARAKPSVASLVLKAALSLNNQHNLGVSRFLPLHRTKALASGNTKYSCVGILKIGVTSSKKKQLF